MQRENNIENVCTSNLELCFKLSFLINTQLTLQLITQMIPKV